MTVRTQRRRRCRLSLNIMTFGSRVLPALGPRSSALTPFCVLALMLSPSTVKRFPAATTRAPVQEASQPISGAKQDEKKSKTSGQSDDQQKKTNPGAKGQQTKRMLWVVPNFAAVSANVQFKPLTPRQKFSIALDDSFDYSSFTWTAIEAAQGLALNSDPELGSGISGYGSYYWHNYVDGVSGTLFTEAIVPTLTHEDPRYFTMGEGGFLRRAEYALTRTFLTKTDSGGTTFNWSEVGGNALEAGLSNAYYPAEERTFSATMQNWGVQMESAALNNLAKEFWPDIRRKLLREK
jgi:hypothetical protein